MKYLTVIWATLILALACFPCMDGNEAFAQGVNTVVQADEVHQDGAHSEELCTPLCDCNCCGGIKMSFPTPQLAAHSHVQHDAYFSAYLERGAATPLFPFWHPPRV